MNSEAASYQIMRKEPDNTTVLIEAVKGLVEAERRVRQLNKDGPGEHFVFDPLKATVIGPGEPVVGTDPFDP